MSLLTEIVEKLKVMPDKERKQLEQEVMAATKNLIFIPNVGPQTRAYYSEADILLYGGEPGGGKTGLLIGLALNCHERSLIVRKQFNDLEGIIDNAKEMVGSDEGFVGGNRPKYRKPDGGVIHFQGMGGGDFDDSKQGTPHDLIGIDEGAQLSENQTRLLIGWNRTKKPGQRKRMVIASNPPVDPVGDWMADFFGPWLNPAHPNPALDGELRWFVIGPEGESIEVAGPDTVEIDGKPYYPHSRTYINAKLEDNPYIDAEDYRRRLQALPEPYRTMLTSGNFLLSRKDQDFQIIPTAWVIAAQARWKPNGWKEYEMTAMGFDPAGGGKDSAELARRHGGWFAELISTTGPETADGSAAAATIIKHRRNNCPVVIDMGGGYGGAVKMRLGDNGIEATAYNGAHGSTAKSKDKQLGFINKRAETLWRIREELDPDQEGGSCIALPPDPILRADLCAPIWWLTSRGIQAESKDDVRKRLGRSTGRGDAVMQALAPADIAIKRSINGQKQQPVAQTSKRFQKLSRTR